MDASLHIMPTQAHIKRGPPHMQTIGKHGTGKRMALGSALTPYFNSFKGGWMERKKNYHAIVIGKQLNKVKMEADGRDKKRTI